jgi:hypothetical protein
MTPSTALSALLLLTAGLMLAPDAHARRITTVLEPQGDGVTPFMGADPVIVDGAGNVYALSEPNNTVFKVTPAGAVSVILTAAGDGAGTPLDCDLGGCAMALAPAGDLYVSSVAADAVLRVAPGGAVTTAIGSAGDGMGNTLNFPNFIGTDSAGNLFVSGQFSDTVFKVTPGGVVTAVLTATGDGLGNLFESPFGMVVDAGDNVFVVAAASRNLFRIAPSGIVTEMLDVTGDGIRAFIPGISQLDVDAAGNVYAPSQGSDAVFKVTPSGVITTIIDASGDGAGHPLKDPFRVAVDGDGNVHVAGLFTNLFRVDPAGVVSFIAAFPDDLVGLVEDGAGGVYPATLSGMWRVVGDRLRVLFDVHGDGTEDVAPMPAVAASPGVAYVSVHEPEDRVYRVDLVCDPAPRVGCHGTTKPGASKLQVKELPDEGKDLVSWKWKGAATAVGEFGSPASLDYSLCVYEAGTQYAAFEASVPAGATCASASCWRARGTTGFTHGDRGDRAPDGVSKIILKAGADGKANAALTANKENVVDLALPLTRFPLVAQLQASNGECWEATYSQPTPSSNSATKLNAKSD